MLGLEKEAQEFFEAVVRVGRGRVGEKSIIFWRRAAERPLWHAPEEDDGDESGKEGWLWELEVEGQA